MPKLFTFSAYLSYPVILHGTSATFLFLSIIQQMEESRHVVRPNGFIFLPHFDALKIISSGIGHVVLYVSNQIALFSLSLYFRVKRNSSEHVPSVYSCNSVNSAPGSIFQHQLVKQFQISTPTLAYSYSYPPP